MGVSDSIKKKNKKKESPGLAGCQLAPKSILSFQTSMA